MHTRKNTFTMPKPCAGVGKSVPAALTGVGKSVPAALTAATYFVV